MYILKGEERNGVYPIEDDFGNNYHFAKKEVLYMLKKGTKIKGLHLEHGEIILDSRTKANAGVRIASTYLNEEAEQTTSVYDY